MLKKLVKQQGSLRRQLCSRRDRIVINKVFTQDDLDKFTQVTGDTNPIHTVKTEEKKRYVHGALLNGIISSIIGTKLPGAGSIVISQKLDFPNQCRLHTDTEITVQRLTDRKISLVAYECLQEGKVVFKGEAKVISAKYVDT